MPSKTKKNTKSKSKSKYLDNSDSSHNSSETSDYELSDYEQRKVVRKSNKKTRKTNVKPLKQSGNRRSIDELNKIIETSSESESLESESSESESSSDSETDIKSISKKKSLNKKEYFKRKSSKKFLTSESQDSEDDTMKIPKRGKREQLYQMIDKKHMNNIIFQDINEKYAYGQYGDFVVIIDKLNGYINMTKLCEDGGSKFYRWTESKKHMEMLKVFEEKCDPGISGSPKKMIIQNNNGYPYIVRGSYVHPKLVPHVASWCNPEFALKVSDIVNAYLLNEFKKESEKFEEKMNGIIEKKNDKIDKLFKKIDKQTNKIDEQTNKIDEQTNKIDEQKKQIEELLEQGNEVLGYAKDTNRKINVVVNERVPMSDKPKNEESFYIVKNNDKVKPGKSKSKKKIYGYKAIRITNKSKSSTMSRYYKDHPKGKIILKIKYTPNAKHLWNACKDKIYIKDENITPGNNAFCYFNLCKGYSEHKLKKDVMKIHNNRLNHNNV
ncbi:putative KilA-N domain-containing protein [Cotonvirus japonicus]|uniref:KilA-N domain-containing protein n=1 Tax=Cotonvirus japonicus TaxID=2811091 RepID=A0ABM7NR35_9VIRU|nr:putative KilA-N domain-containing protein [Cotonvirus japonicus]BCS82622.1 putative KilA-N domain-containing protein [Cotonvirus japonicus]